MRTPSRLLLFIFVMGCSPVAPPPPPGPRGAFEYVEHQIDNGGELRRLQSRNGPLRGLDIQSRLAIEVDEALLAARQRSPEPETIRERRTALRARLQSLNEALGSISAVVAAGDQASALYQEALKRDDIAIARPAVAERNRLQRRVRNALLDAIQARAEETGTSEADARDVAVAAVRPALANPSHQSDFNWETMADLLQAELEAAGDEIRALEAAPRLSLEISAFHLGRDGVASAAPLAGYNTIRPGAVVLAPKVQFSASSEEIALFREYEKAIAGSSRAATLSEATLQALRMEHQRVGLDLTRLATEAATAWQEVDGEVANLLSWSDPATWQALLQHPDIQVSAGEAGEGIRDLLERFDQAARETRRSVQPAVGLLEDLSHLPRDLGSMTPEAAMSAILTGIDRSRSLLGNELFTKSLWSRWRKLAEDMTEELRELPGGPVRSALLASQDAALQDLMGLANALAALSRLAEDVDRAALAWAQDVLQSEPARAFDQFPVPEGQKRLPLDGELDTTLDLRTLPFARAENDRIRLRYAVIKADTTISTWDDDFELRSFGWNARVIASLAMTTTDLDGAWRPTAALNWMLKNNGWPEDYEPGTTYPWWHHLSYGFSTMALDNDPAQAVELGLAGTVGLFDSRIMAGFGVNLQSGNSRFGFFSIRLFSAGGGLGTINDG